MPLMAPRFLEEIILCVKTGRHLLGPHRKMEELHKCFVFQPHTAASMGLSSELSLIHSSFLENRQNLADKPLLTLLLVDGQVNIKPKTKPKTSIDLFLSI